jgi:hypothetical protein
MELKFTNLAVIGRVSWSAITQCNPRSDGVLCIKSLTRIVMLTRKGCGG